MCLIAAVETREARAPRCKGRYGPQQEFLYVFGTQAKMGLIDRLGGGARDHSYERVKGHVPPLETMEASGPKIKGRYLPQQENLVVLVTFATSE